MSKYISNLRNFDEIDIGLLAVTGLSLGAIIGAAKKAFVKKFSWMFAIVGIAGSVYLLLKVVGKATIAYDKVTPIKYEG